MAQAQCSRWLLASGFLERRLRPVLGVRSELSDFAFSMDVSRLESPHDPIDGAARHWAPEATQKELLRASSFRRVVSRVTSRIYSIPATEASSDSCEPACVGQAATEQ